MRDMDWSRIAKFLTPVARSDKIHSNFIFRFSHCGLSDLKAASSASVDLEQIYRWDDGEDIPLSVRRLWLYESGRVLPVFSGFSGWSFRGGRIITPDGGAYTSTQLRLALYRLDEGG